MKVFNYIWKKRAAYLMVAPLMIGIMVFCYYPPIYGILLSFTDKTDVNVASFIKFDNFTNLFKDPIFKNSFGTMAKLQIPRLIAGIVVPLVYAEIIHFLKGVKVQGVYRLLILLPVVAPGVVATLVWKQLYQVDGLINEILKITGILSRDASGINWLGDANYVIYAILFMGFPWIGGTAVLIYLSGIMNIPKDLFEAAELDGAGALTVIFKIHLPLISGQIRYFLIFGLINGFQDYGTQVVLTQGGPGFATYVPAYYMFELMSSHSKYGPASAIGVVLFVIIIAVTVISFKFVKFGESKNDIQ